MKKNKWTFNIISVCLIFSGMAFGQASLKGQVWTLTSLGNQGGTSQTVSGNNYTIEFNANGQAAIKADCNNCGATYQTSGTDLSITLGMCSKMACGNASLDNQFLAQLALVKSWESNTNSLFLKSAANKTLLTLTNGLAVDPPVGTKPADAFYQDWNLIRIGLTNKVSPKLDQNHALSFKKNGTASYNLDCNTCGSSFGATGSKLKIGMGSCTMMACSEIDLASPYLTSVIVSQDSVNYQLAGNELWLFFNAKKDTLIYHNKQTSKLSKEHFIGLNFPYQWSLAASAGSVTYNLSRAPGNYRVTVYNMRGEQIVTKRGDSEIHGQLEYSFQPGTYLFEMELEGQKQVQALTIK